MNDLRDGIERLAQSCGGTVSVSVRDISKAFDFSFNADAPIVAASTIKVPIMIETLKQARDGRISLSTEYVLRKTGRVAGSGVISQLSDGLLLTIRDLLTLMIIVSDNTATNMLIDIVGMSSVNATMQAMGYKGLTLRRKMYDWDAVAQGVDNRVVAAEMADLLARMARGVLLGSEEDALALQIMRGQLYNHILGLFLPEGVLANKTGQVGTALNDCGIVATDQFSYAVAIFTQDTDCLGETQIAVSRMSKLICDAAACKNCG